MKIDKITEITAALLGVFLHLVGGWTVPLRILIIFAVLDYITGVAIAFMGKSKKTPKGGLSSGVSAIGIIKKFGIMIVIIVAAQIEILVGLTHNAISQGVVYMFIASEGISILENTAALGVVRIPVLNKILEQLKSSPPMLGQILIEKGILTEEQLHSALKEQEEINK